MNKRRLAFTGMLGAMVALVALFAAGLVRDATPATAGPPPGEGMDLDASQLEPLCAKVGFIHAQDNAIKPSGGADTPAGADGTFCVSNSALGSSGGFSSIIDAQFGSPIPALRTFTEAAWFTNKTVPLGTPVAALLVDVDLFCEGTPDVLAHESSKPPSFAPMIFSQGSVPIPDWLGEQVPDTTLFTVHGRIESVLTNLFTFYNLEAFPLPTDVPLNLVIQEIPWSKLDPKQGQRAHLSTVVLGGDPAPANPLCVGARQYSITNFPGHVVQYSPIENLNAAAADNIVITLSVPTAFVVAGGGQANPSACDLTPGHQVSKTPETWQVNWPTKCWAQNQDIEIYVGLGGKKDADQSDDITSVQLFNGAALIKDLLAPFPVKDNILLNSNPLPSGDGNGDGIDDNEGYYIRWQTAAGLSKWSPNPKPDQRSAELDIEINLRCYMIHDPAADKATALARHTDADGDCLEDASTIEPGRNPDPDDSLNDIDLDGLYDSIEVAWGSDPNNGDTDGDSYSDPIEMYLNTNPNSDDTDGDGVKDPVDNCPTIPNADQADQDRDAWTKRSVEFHIGIVPASVSNDATDTKAVAKTKESVFKVGVLLLPNTLADGGGDACDNDDDGDQLHDFLECENPGKVDHNSEWPKTCDKKTDSPSLAVVVTDDLLKGDFGVQSWGCAKADQDGDTVQDLPNVFVYQHDDDSDGDTVVDGVECLWGSIPAGNGDANGNGQQDIQADLDGDTTPEVIDAAASVPECTPLDNLPPKADPNDRDADGEPNSIDCPPGSSEENGDVEGDGLSNLMEIYYQLTCVRVDLGNHQIVTDKDSDVPKDGVADDPSYPCGLPLLAPSWDYDGDTIDDVWNDPDNDGVMSLLDSDSDGDGLSDWHEVSGNKQSIVTDPSHADTDGDSCTDDKELAEKPVRDPRDGQDFYDMDGSNAIAIADIVAVVGVFGASVGSANYSNMFDTDLSGAIAIADIVNVVSQFGKSCP